jgi:hypothetical protein
MMTPTHVFLNWALFEKRGASPRERLAIIGGALTPDIGVWVFSVWFFSTVGFTFGPEWETLYRSEHWSAFFNLTHSFLLWPLLVGIGIFFRRRILALFAGSALLHACCDFLVHADDAYAHFFPLSAWKFQSPISYWDPRHFGDIVAPLDSSVGLVALVYVYPRVQSWWGKALCIFFGILFLLHTLQRLFVPIPMEH